MDSKKLALLCRKLADNRKAEHIQVLDVRELSSVTDFYVLASGTSDPHLRAIVDELTTKLRDEEGLRPKSVDFFDVIIHVMRAEVREKYDLEGLWSDAPRLKTRKTKSAAQLV
jgi:ribosome-associated protein